MEVVSEKIFVDIPQSDLTFFKQFADKMGWKVKMQQNLWNEYIMMCPKEVELSDEDIMAEVRAIRSTISGEQLRERMYKKIDAWNWEQKNEK